MRLMHGGGGTAFKEWAERWAKRGYVALAMDLAGHGPGRKRLPDGSPDQDPKSRFEAGAVGDRWSYHAVANVIRGVSLLVGPPEVDAGRVGITGIPSALGYLTQAEFEWRWRADRLPSPAGPSGMASRD
jgi:dienelactone hydrolase